MNPLNRATQVLPDSSGKILESFSLEMACKTVLIVEDDIDIRNTLKEVLELEGYHVVTASNGREGVDTLKSARRPCLILLDLMMPVMNGWEFLAEQKEDVMLATIPVVVVSAAGEKARTAPAQGFIKKPVELDALLRVVKQYCG